jgi:elongation factor Ts
MADISASDVRKLRDMTGAGMMDCKKALEESGGDFDAAVEYLRKKGQKISEKRADREAKEGAIFVARTADGARAAMIELNCETDFVARNEDFQKLGQAIAEAALAAQPTSLDALLALPVEGKPLTDALAENMGKIGEKLEVRSMEQMSASKVIPYLHIGGRVGVLVAFEGGNGELESVGRDVAMQIAAMNPLAIDETGVSQEVKDRETRIALEQMQADPANASKPKDILEKIVAGKVHKYIRENTLLAQEFVKDPSQTVEKFLQAKGGGAKVVAFRRMGLGS